MNLRKIYIEEDLFPREITLYEKRDYGFLFYSEENKDSYDSNHAIIFKNKVFDLKQVLNDIICFYTAKGIKPSIYQSICDDGYFEEIKKELADYGFEYWNEPQKYMVLSKDNTIISNSGLVVQRVYEWKDEYGKEIFEKAGEPWEMDITKKSLTNNNTLFFVAFYSEKPVGMIRCHITDDVCRVDYLLVSKEHRNMSVGRTLVDSFVKYCKENEVVNCYLWPDGETAERIYYEAGFRHIDTKQAGRATYNRD